TSEHQMPGAGAGHAQLLTAALREHSRAAALREVEAAAQRLARLHSPTVAAQRSAEIDQSPR
ncbi:MAG TPA: hypothetical protein VED45_02340, partial [Steroidobacteraceae bacterium]|nr:hypothetical protein [Steroidobacteraceae bacterium]